MIRTSVFAACFIAAGVLAAPAYAQSVGEKTGVNSALGITPSTPDFVREAAMSDMFEIQSSQLAEQKAADQPTKTFAQKMVTDHTKTSSEMKRMVSGGKLKAWANKTLPDLQGHLKMAQDLDK